MMTALRGKMMVLSLRSGAAGRHSQMGVNIRDKHLDAIVKIFIAYTASREGRANVSIVDTYTNRCSYLSRHFKHHQLSRIPGPMFCLLPDEYVRREASDKTEALP